jgi:uncharacterized protein
MENQEFLNKVKDIINKIDNDATIILFGSRARGDFNETSDWDLLILLNTPVDEVLKTKIRIKLFETELETDQVISTIIHSTQNWENLNITPFYEIIKKEGVIV